MICFMPVVLGVRFNIRVEDLNLDYALQFTCFHCGHFAIVSATLFKTKYPPHQRLVELEPKFKCGNCQNKISNGWKIVRRMTQAAPEQAKSDDIVPVRKQV
jgi:transcription elongation factor Elf1